MHGTRRWALWLGCAFCLLGGACWDRRGGGTAGIRAARRRDPCWPAWNRPPASGCAWGRRQPDRGSPSPEHRSGVVLPASRPAANQEDQRTKPSGTGACRRCDPGWCPLRGIPRDWGSQHCEPQRPTRYWARRRGATEAFRNHLHAAERREIGPGAPIRKGWARGQGVGRWQPIGGGPAANVRSPPSVRCTASRKSWTTAGRRLPRATQASSMRPR